MTPRYACKMPSERGHGLQHAHRDQHLRLLGSLPDELGGLEQAASVQQQRGPQQRPELRLFGLAHGQLSGWFGLALAFWP